MLTLLRNIDCYCPAHLGKKDILIAGSRIYKITPAGEITDSALLEHIINCEGLCALPGFIDQHVHIIGAGGEQGYASRSEAIQLEEILNAGITTLVGLLGADGVTRTMEDLYAKAKALEAQGLTTFIYSGSYAVPPVTLTGKLIRDMVFIDKVIGAGEIAVSDHRSTNPSVNELMKIAADTHLGGLITGKAGVVHMHIGDGKSGLKTICDLVRDTDVVLEQLIPTHTNRNQVLLLQAAEYCRMGGRIDLTAGETDGVSVPAAIKQLQEDATDLSNVTVSSDAGGSIPSGGVAVAGALYTDFLEIINQSILPPEKALCLFTENVAKALKIYPMKGILRVGSDADILITDQAYHIKMLLVMGRVLLNKLS